MSKELDVLEQADELLNDFVEAETRRAFKKITEVQGGKGCQCHACKTHAIAEVNSWVHFVCLEEESEIPYQFHLDEKGTVYRGEEHERDDHISESAS